MLHDGSAGVTKMPQHLVELSISNGTVLENVFSRWFELTGAVQVQNLHLDDKSHFEVLIVPLTAMIQ